MPDIVTLTESILVAVTIINDRVYRHCAVMPVQINEAIVDRAMHHRSDPPHQPHNVDSDGGSNDNALGSQLVDDKPSATLL